MPRRFVIVFVVDGLRPDHITVEDTPTLHRLRTNGVDFLDSHAVFPTVTRVNSATLATGMQPGTHGIIGNQLYVPAVDPRRAFDTGNYRNLVRLSHPTTLADRLHARGRSLAAVSSGSTGSAFLLNPHAPRGVGMLVNGYFDPGKTVAWPPDRSAAILAKFGLAPQKKRGERYDGVVAWTQRVLREYVIPECAPDVVIDWLTEPDHTQHAVGVGSAAARETIANADREIAHVLSGLSLGSTDVFVVSDHGFTTNRSGVDVRGALEDAKLPAVIASSGQAVAVHAERRYLPAIVRMIQAKDWGGVLFTAGRAPGDPHGIVDGTFSLDLIHLAHGERSADLVFTFPWTSDRSKLGVRGTDLAAIGGAGSIYHSDHGSMSPWNVRNTFIAWGASFKSGVAVRTPVGNVDVAPTILALLGITDESDFDGRVLREALAGGPDEETIAVDTRTHTVGAGDYRAAIQVSLVDDRRYVDKSWRIAAPARVSTGTRSRRAPAAPRGSRPASGGPSGRSPASPRTTRRRRPG